MQHHIYILTDINRKSLHVGTTSDLNEAVKTYREMYTLFFDAGSQISRLVYKETYASEEAALMRFEELKNYTRMQKERLIRRHNPDWVDMSLIRREPLVNPKRMLLFSQSKTQKQIA